MASRPVSIGSVLAIPSGRRAADLARRSEMFSLPVTGPFPSEIELRERTRRITGCVPCYHWQVGRAAPRDADGLRRFVAGLGAAG